MSVYFIFAADANLVKIGHAKNVWRRFQGIRTGSPVALTLLATEDGGAVRESKLHIQFSNLRKHGEWFEFTDDLVSYVSSLIPFTVPVKRAALKFYPEFSGNSAIPVHKLYGDIISFCKTNYVPVSNFGVAAMNDKAFVLKLRNGRRLWPETEMKVRNFMADYRAERDAA